MSTPRLSNVKLTAIPEGEQLRERVVKRENMQKADARVLRNKGGPGIDKMTVSALTA